MDGRLSFLCENLLGGFCMSMLGRFSCCRWDLWLGSVVLDVGICGWASAGIWGLYSGVFRGDGVSWVRV